MMKVSIVNKSCFSLPKYETIGSAGMDLRADLTRCDYSDVEFKSDIITLKLSPRKVYMIPTGLFISLPQPVAETYTGEGYGYEAQIRPRSGLAAKYGITLVNSPGTIDCVIKGTKIKTVMGDINVEDLYDKENKSIIYSYNDDIDEIEEDIVDNMWIVKNKSLLKITTEEKDIIEIPPEKEVFTNRGWVEARNLKESDKILKYK